MKKLIVFIFCLFLYSYSFSQINGNFSVVRAEVDFTQKLRDWDGFGFNYVETAQTLDYEKDPQEYGGFSLLDDNEKEEIIDMVFGEDGLKVGVVKMFLDPFQQNKPGGSFDHETTTENMREFVRKGLETTRARDADLQIITTLYGPPAFCTQQKVLRGRDMDPDMKEELANYMIDWAKYLKTEEHFPVKYISLHNEGEDRRRWNLKGDDEPEGWGGHDYNMYWPPELVADMIKIMRPMMDNAGLDDVGITPGETSNWYRFSAWGYANEIANDPEAVEDLGIVTSHGFYNGRYGYWFGEHRSVGIDIIRDKKPGTHCWVTSTSWSDMDADFIKEVHGNIYTAKVNAIIPWAGIQRPTQWVGGDPNPGSAFTVSEDGDYTVRKGYYYYKQVTRAGQPGMGVAWTMAMHSEIAIIAFDDNGTDNSNAFVVVNRSDNDLDVNIALKGSESNNYQAYRTNDAGDEQYKALGSIEVENDAVRYSAPKKSVTTFFAD